jgi:hypothetical protein
MASLGAPSRQMAGEISGERIDLSRYIPAMFRLQPELILLSRTSASHGPR